MSIPLPKNDPAYWMLENGMAGKPGWVTQTHDETYSDKCYICKDPQFALMGLPVCKPCPICGVHWAADDGECDNGCDIYDYYHPEDKENT